MALIYASIDRIAKRLAGRLTIAELSDYGITGITGTQIGTDLIYIVGEAVEEWIDMYLKMIYQMPLVNEHKFLSAIVEKLIISEIYSTYFPSSTETPDNTEAFSNVLRNQALNEFQSLFNGLGIFVPGASTDTWNIQNEETKTQMINKAIILPGEVLKKYIGYDYNGDNLPDSDLFKLNTNVQPSFYTTGMFEKVGDYEELINGIRVRPRGGSKDEEVSFY